MAGTNLGTAYVTIMPSAKGISGSITNALGGEATSAGTSAGNLFTTALKGVLMGAGAVAVKKFFSDAIGEAGELQQNLGGSEAVFGEYASTIQGLAKDAYKNMGLSASEYMATANKMGSLFQGSGLEQQRALELTTEAMQRASDVASVMGISQTMAMESIAGAAKGNFTMMDNLGVAMNATTLQAYALEKGVNFKWDTASNAEKAELAMQMFMERTSQYAGNFAKESVDTYTGSLGAMKAVSKNVMANLALGEDIKEPLNALAQTTKNYLKQNLFPMIGNVIKGVGGLIGDALTNGLKNLPNAVEGAKNFLNKLAEGFQNNSGVIIEKLKYIGGLALNALKNTDWVGLGKSVINLIISGLTAVGSTMFDVLKEIGASIYERFTNADIDWAEAGKNILTKIGEGLGQAGRFLFDKIGEIGEQVKEFMKNVDWQQVGVDVVTAIGHGLKTFGEAIKTIFTTAKESFKDIDWPEVGRNIIDFIVTGATSVGEFLWGGLKTIGETAWDKLKEVDWIQLGKDIITLIWEGLGAIGSWIWEKLKSLGQIAKTKFENIEWLELGKTVIKTIWEGLGTIGHWIWEKLKLLGDTAVAKVKEIEWLQLGKDIITFIWDGLTELGHTIWEKLKEIGEKALGWLLGTDPESGIDWAGVGESIITFIVGGLAEFGHNIWEGLKDVGKKALDWLTGDDPASGIDWYGAGGTIDKKVGDGIGGMASSVQNGVDMLAGVVLNSLGSINTYGIGANAMIGFVNGMNDYFGYAQEMAIGLANAVSAAFCGIRAFNINSPSKLMRDKVGKPIVEGIVVGMEESMGLLDTAVDDIVKTTTGAVPDISTDFAQNVSMNTTPASTAAESPITINVYPSAGMNERDLADKVQQQLALAQRQRQAAWGTA